MEEKSVEYGSEKIWKLWKKNKLNSEDLENTKENCEMICKL
jgi:hypothetical protein